MTCLSHIAFHYYSFTYNVYHGVMAAVSVNYMNYLKILGIFKVTYQNRILATKNSAFL